MAPRIRHGEHGFTLVELLVVILIVAILTAVTAPVLLNQRHKAQDAEAKAGAKLVAETLLVYEHDYATFAGADRTRLIAIEPAVASARGLIVNGDDDSFEVSVDSRSGDAGGGPFVIEYEAGRTDRTCLQPGDGGCRADGHW
jgi:prepilin-type N-terminal cleavage/methylation domain-containing protein